MNETNDWINYDDRLPDTLDVVEVRGNILGVLKPATFHAKSIFRRTKDSRPAWFDIEYDANKKYSYPRQVTDWRPLSG